MKKLLFFVSLSIFSQMAFADYGSLAVSRTNALQYAVGYGYSNYASDSSAMQQCGPANASCRVVLRFAPGSCAVLAVDNAGKAAGWFSHTNLDEAIINATDKCVEAGPTSACNVVFSQCL